MKGEVSDTLKDYYTDILAHSYEPGGYRIAAGTTFGKVIILERDSERNEAYSRMEGSLPNSAAVLGLHWSGPGLFVSSKSLLYLYKLKDQDQKDPYSAMEVDNEENSSIVKEIVKFECMFDVQDVTTLTSGTTVFGACDDCKVRAWDVETQKLLMEYSDHKMPVEVCRANEEYVVSGGQDGNVLIYDGKLRSPKAVASFEQGKTMITGVDISSNSTWVAAGSKSTPLIYNLKNAAILPQIDIKKSNKIHTVHFDDGDILWWAGSGGVVYKSADLTTLSTEMKTSYGEANIYHIYSITTSSPANLSVAGASTGILFSDNSDYWEGMVHI